MADNKTIYGRRSIHNRDSETPQRDDSEYEDEGDTLPNESLEQFSTESGSDFEGFDANNSLEYKRKEIFEISRSVPRTPQRPKRPLLNTTSRSAYSPESYKSQKILQTKSTGGSKSYFPAIAVLILFVAAGVYALVQQKEIPNKNGQKNCSYQKLEKQYPQENTWLWRSLTVGIESILNERTQTPGVYLFVHHGGEHVYQLVKDIAAHSSSCFGQEMRPVQMESEDFISSLPANDYGHAIEKYKMKIKEGNVILIANLNEIPAEAARALHTICDTHSPIAKDVVIFLTLTIPTNQEGGNVESIAEDTLIKLWAPKLGRNELDPLITRVTDQVIALQS